MPRAVRAGTVALLAGLAALGLYLLLDSAVNNGVDDAFDRVLVSGLILGSGFLCLSRAILVRSERVAWTFLSLDLLGWGIAEVLWNVIYATDPTPPYPSVADAFYLVSYPLSYIGIALLVRDRVRRFRATTWFDGAIAALTIAAVWAAVVLPDLLSGSEGQLLVDATTAAYPIADMLLLAFLFGVLVIVGRGLDATWGLISASLLILAFADTVYSYQEVAGTYVEGAYLDLLWPLSAVLLAMAAWAPGRRESAASSAGWRSIGTPSMLALGAGGLLVYGSLESLDPVAIYLAAGALLASGIRLGLTYRDNLHLFERTQTDALTGLHNRSRLLIDLQDAITDSDAARPSTLLMLDLNGFKAYNDTFGHPAGDALLQRLSEQVAAAASGQGSAYRIGGDEFCVLLGPSRQAGPTGPARIAASLRDHGEGFEISAAMGASLIPAETADPAEALQIADRRMYEDKATSRVSARRQAKDVLMSTLREREPALGAHVDAVTRLSIAVARRLGIDGEELDVVSRAAELHDIGKMAIPDAVLNKGGPLDPIEWRFIADHTIVGERILRSAPALAPVAELVRASHERWDGDGYPDGLSGSSIPIGARIIFACDALQAMTSDRPYAAAIPLAEAIEELRSCAGGQFDPAVVEALCVELAATPESHAVPALKPD